MRDISNLLDNVDVQMTYQVGCKKTDATLPIPGMSYLHRKQKIYSRNLTIGVVKFGPWV